jgi:anaerobic selenocysteine-containing dehydrogenase
MKPAIEQPVARHTAVKIRSAVCPYCGVGCRVTARVVGDRIDRVYADRNEEPNFGMLCQKGATLGDPGVWDEQGRLTHPMIRQKRGEAHRPVTWDEAATFIADRLRAIQSEHGRQAAAFYGSGQCDTEASYLFSKLFKGYLRSNHVDSNSRLCMSSAVAAYHEAFGSDGPPTCYDDIHHARVFLILGANMAANHPVLFNLVKRRRQADPSVRIIVVDPRRTATAEQADVHLPVAPGGDVALIQIIASRLLAMGRVDWDFVGRHCENFSAYQAHLAALDQEALLAGCGVDETAIDQVVEMLSDEGGLLSLYCQGANQSTSGVDKNLAMIHLHLQLGQIGRPGAGPFSLTGQPNAMGGREVGYLSHQLPGYRQIGDAGHRAEIERIWGLAEGSIDPEPGLSAAPLFEAAAAGRIQAIWTVCTNPVVSMPDASVVRQALSRAKLVIHQDCYHPTETGLHADVLLPAAQWGEKTGTMTNSERLVTRSQKFFDAPGEAMPDWWIAARVGQALGFDGFGHVTAEQVWDEIRLTTAGRPCEMMGITNARLARGPVRWPCADEQSAGTPRRYTDGRFHTDTGRARFSVLTPRGPQEALTADYPLGLTTGRVASQWHTRTRTGRVQALARQEPDPFVEIHPADAVRYGLHDGQWVRLTSRRGAATGRLRVTETIRPGLLFMPFHWGDLHSPDTNVNLATNSALDPRSRQPELKFCAVRIASAAAPTPGAGIARDSLVRQPPTASPA